MVARGVSGEDLSCVTIPPERYTQVPAAGVFDFIVGRELFDHVGNLFVPFALHLIHPLRSAIATKCVMLNAFVRWNAVRT